MRCQECRYGFIIIETELWCVHADPTVGLKVATVRTQSREGLTVCLALWYLHMLARDVPLPGQSEWVTIRADCSQYIPSYSTCTSNASDLEAAGFLKAWYVITPLSLEGPKLWFSTLYIQSCYLFSSYCFVSSVVLSPTCIEDLASLEPEYSDHTI